MDDLTDTRLAEAVARLRAGELAAYLGPGLLGGDDAPAPPSPAALAAALAARIRLPARVWGNCWAAAQFIENRRFRATLDSLMGEIFAADARPSPLHHAIAALRPPLIVDTWYDATMRRALCAHADWAELQATPRVTPGEDRWVRAYDFSARPLPPADVADVRTLLYKPHGAVKPARSFLLTDADYVEVLTEIDIQTPIPDAVRKRRSGRGFLFLGCRFDDQTLRIFARQIAKRSGGRHVALFDEPATLTANEIRFLAEIGCEVLACPIATFAERLG